MSNRAVGQPGKAATMKSQTIMMAASATLDRDRDTCTPGKKRRVRGNRRAAPLGSEDTCTRIGEGVHLATTLMRSPDGKSQRGDDGGKALEVVEMMTRRKMEVLLGQETKWKGDRARKMAEGYEMPHTGGYGRSNCVGIIVIREC